MNLTKLVNQVLETRRFQKPKYTPTQTDKEMGKFSWDIEYLPDLASIYSEVNKFEKDLKDVLISDENLSKDKELIEFLYGIRQLKNKLGAHLRKNYPDAHREAKKITG